MNNAEITPKSIKVHIFENFGTDEKAANLREGVMFNKLLSALEIENSLFEIMDRNDAIAKITVAGKTFSKYDINIIHWSGHGNLNGVQLSSGEILIWEEFAELFYSIAEHEREKMVLCLSSCEGAGASILESMLPGRIYGHLIAPSRKIGWNEAAVAYTNFYYSILNQHLNIGDAVSWMNTSIFSNDSNVPFLYFNGKIQKMKYKSDIPVYKAMLKMIEKGYPSYINIYND